MGTDIYLSYKGMTKNDKKAQYTGWSIDAGKFGYLRASIGMATENAVLRMVFPNEYWEEDKPKRFHFTEDVYKKLHAIGLLYLRQNLIGTPIKNSEHEKHTEVFKELFKQLAENLEADEIVEGNIDCFRSAIMWINSLFSFYELGMEKEKEGKEPKVYISW